MRHLKRTAKLGRTSEHRNAMLANLVRSLIKHKRITTTLAKAKAARPVAEKLITLGKEGTLTARRRASAKLRVRGRSLELTKEQYKQWRQKEDVVRILFDELAPLFKERRGGYTRIVKLGEPPPPCVGRLFADVVCFWAWVRTAWLACAAPRRNGGACVPPPADDASPGTPDRCHA